jgi:hypothetical protein
MICTIHPQLNPNKSPFFMVIPWLSHTKHIAPCLGCHTQQVDRGDLPSSWCRWWWWFYGNMMGRWWEYDGNMGISHHLYPFLPFVSSCLHLAAAWRWFSATTATRGSSYVKSSAMWGWLTHRPSLQRYIHNNPHNIAIDRLQESSPNGMFSWIYHICISFTS